MPALDEPLALAHVVDRQMHHALPSIVGDQLPLVGGLLGAERMLRGKEPRKLGAERALAAEAGEHRSEPAAQELLADGGAGPFQEDAAVEEQGPANVDVEFA